MTEKTNVLAVVGSMREESVTRKLVSIAADAARKAGAKVDVVDLAKLDLPMLKAHSLSEAQAESVKRVHESAAWADAFIIGTPEYHGGPSGAVKNWIDHLYADLAGKVAGLVGAAGGGRADQALGQLEVHSRMCHMWTIPFISATSGRDFDGDKLTNERVEDRLIRLGYDLTRYGALLRDQFAADKERGEGPESGFAGWHVSQKS